MRKYLISVSYVAILVFSANLFADGADKAKKALGFIAGEILSTEETYQKNLYTFLLKLTEHQQVFKKALGTLREDAIKRVFYKSKIEDLTDFDAKIAKAIPNVKNILKNSVEVTKQFTALAKAAKEANVTAMLPPINEIRKLFDDQFFQPYKEYVERYETNFPAQYGNLFKQYNKDKMLTFLNEAEQYLILPVQRGPRYKLLFEDFNKQIAEWEKADQAEKGLSTLKIFSQQLLKTIMEKTKF